MFELLQQHVSVVYSNCSDVLKIVCGALCAGSDIRVINDG